MTEETSKMAIQLVERLGLPICLVGIFIWALWARTSNFLATQKEYMDKERATCEAQLDVQEQQLAVLRELRDAMRLARAQVQP